MRPRILRAYAGIVDIAALLVLFLLGSEGIGERPGTLLTLLVLAVLVGSRPVRIPSLHIQVAALDLFVFCALLTLSPLAAPLVGFFAVASALFGPRRRPLSVRTAFNLGLIPLSAGLAALTYGGLVSEGMTAADRYAIPLLAATAVYFLVNTGLTALAIAFEARGNVATVWWGFAPWNGAATLASMLMSVGLAVLLDTVGPVVLLLGLVATLPILAQGRLKAIETRPS
jgi:hypothetical protein